MTHSRLLLLKGQKDNRGLDHDCDSVPFSTKPYEKPNLEQKHLIST